MKKRRENRWEKVVSAAAPAKEVPNPKKAAKKEQLLKAEEVLPSFAVCFVR